MATEAHGGAAAEHAVGMPQLDVTTWPNQIFWLVVTLAVIYLVLSRIARYTLPLNCGRARSNALRGTMFTEPASAEPGDSGVGECTASTRDRLLIETAFSSTAAMRSAGTVPVSG